MGRRGPAPEPDEAKIARGETRPSQLRGNGTASAVRPGAPTMPRGMKPRAQSVWKALLRDAPPSMISRLDAHVLRVFCESVVRYEEASAMYAELPPLIEGRKGLVKNPLAQVVRDQADLIRLFGRELGLSPAARAGLVGAIGGENELDIDDDLGPPPRLRVVNGD